MWTRVVKSSKKVKESPKAMPQRRTVSVTADFSGRGVRQLSVSEGDFVTVVNDKNATWWWVEDGEGRKGYVPARLLADLDDSFHDNVNFRDVIRSRDDVRVPGDVRVRDDVRVPDGVRFHGNFGSGDDVISGLDAFKKLTIADSGPESFDCAICGEKVAMSGCATVGCRHLFCRDCMSQYVKARIGVRQLADFKCPQPDCDHVADQATVELFLDEEDLRRLQDLQLREAAGSIPEIVSFIQVKVK